MPICKVYVAEQYPTELRGVGTGFGEAVSRVVGGVLATYYLAFFLAMGGVKAVFIFMAVAFRHRHGGSVDLGAGNQPGAALRTRPQPGEN